MGTQERFLKVNIVSSGTIPFWICLDCCVVHPKVLERCKPAPMEHVHLNMRKN